MFSGHDDPVLLPTFDDEVEAVQRAVIGVMHVLVEIAQDEEITTDDRLSAVNTVLAYSEEMHAYTLQDDKLLEEEAHDTDQTHRDQWPVALWQGFRLRRSRGHREPEDG